MKNQVPVEGKLGLYRDSDSSAIINRDKRAYLDYMQRKKVAENKNNELNQMKEDLDNVKGELGEIKSLLSTLVQKLNN
tara:strand:+ start:612 stop:845 length:234 start_codon:yes stop_codon:yes gene_type:complete